MQRILITSVIAILLSSVEMKRPSRRALKHVHGDGNGEIGNENNVNKIAQTFDNLGRSLEYLVVAGVNTNKALKIHRVLKFISSGQCPAQCS